jgi:hypothetical protein
MKAKSEYGAFDRAMRGLLKVPHGEVKAKLDAEKKEKESRPKREKRKL